MSSSTERQLKAALHQAEQSLAAEKRRSAELLSLVDNLEAMVRTLERKIDGPKNTPSKALQKVQQRITTISRASVQRIKTEPSRKSVKRTPQCRRA